MIFDRLLLWRPVQELVVAWRFWTALRKAEHPDWRDRIGWAAGVMMTRSLKAKGHTLPLTVELTEKNAAHI